MHSASLFPAPAGSPSPYRRWTPRGMVEAMEAKGLDVPGFDGAKIFTARDRADDGTLYYRAFEGHYGFAIAGHHLHRNVCEDEARRMLRQAGRAAFEEELARRLAQREADFGGAS